MDYLNTLLQKWMPFQQRVAVDSNPTLHGIWDTINSTLATAGPPTRLPSEFYDSKAYSILNRLVTEEEYSGYKESVEYRTLGIGAMLGETVQRMIHSSSREKENETRISLSSSSSSSGEIIDKINNSGSGSGSGSGNELKFALFGCHDSTIAGVLASLGALEGENHKWPSYTSSLAIELFQQRTIEPAPEPHNQQDLKKVIIPTKVSDLNSDSDPDLESQKYVRIRYNDRPITIPGCRLQGNHFEDDESICTFVSNSALNLPAFFALPLSLSFKQNPTKFPTFEPQTPKNHFFKKRKIQKAFKQIVDKFTPRDWKSACVSNLQRSPFPEREEPAGY